MDVFKESHIEVGIDLTTAAIYQLEFLKYVDHQSHLRNETIVQRAIQRYEKLWLPLAAKYDNEILPAPIDIEWIWHCHMLCPDAYVRDCNNLVGKTVDHELLSLKDRHHRLLKSQSIWKDMYPHEPFEIRSDAGSFSFEHSMFKSTLTYDLVEAAQRQSVFYYQVSLPHYYDQKFLKDAMVRYKKLLFLRKKNPGMFLVPCYDIDLIWHTHQLHPGIYKRDTETYLGRLFNHDDTVNDRNPDSKLSRSNMETREVWRNTFHENFSMYGAMYRGNPPSGKLYQISQKDIFAFSTKLVKIDIRNVDVEGVTSTKGKLKLKVTTKAKSSREQVVCKLKGAVPSWICAESFIYDTLHPSILKFELKQNTGFAFFGKSQSVASYKVDYLEYIDSFASDQSERLNISDISGPYRFTAKADISRLQQGKSLFYMHPGQYETADIPTEVEQMWGPVPLPPLPPNTNNTCHVASHRLNNHAHQVTFTCRLLHSLPLMMSAIHVYYHDKMAAVGHIIGSDQLPLLTQVNVKAKRGGPIILNPGAGERAVLIKNHKGDWGIVIGKWTGFVKGVAGVPATAHKKAIHIRPGCHGWLQFTFHKLMEGTSQTVNLNYVAGNYAFTIEDVTADLETGIINISNNTTAVAENLAIVFAVSLLHVLCVPRPSAWKPGDTLKTPKTSTSRGAKSVQYVPSEDMALIMACGLMMYTPSNHYIHHTFGSHACAGCGGGYVGEIDAGFAVDSDGGCVVDIDGGGDGGGCGGCGGCCACGGCGGYGGCFSATVI